jgi:hypothetical protein
MIICLGPICFPIWHLLPVLLILFTKAKALWYWMLGKPMPVEDKDAKETDGDEPTKTIASAGDANGSLRKRKSEGVVVPKTTQEWKEIIQVGTHPSFPTNAAITYLHFFLIKIN